MTAKVVASARSAERALTYVEALKAGGVAGEAIRVVVAPAAGPVGAVGGMGDSGGAGAGEWMGDAAGLLLCGGADIAPERYGDKALAAAGLELEPARDALEWDLLAAARDRGIPVWGVCRGFQLLNVFLGGSLWQDLPLQRPSGVAHELVAPRDLLAHEARLLAPQAPLGERLAAAGGPPLVNSLHHQGVRRLAPGLLAVAAAPDGLVEAAVLDAGEGSWWVRGVQWHPENLLALAEQRELWRDFAVAVAAFAGGGARTPAVAAATARS